MGKDVDVNETDNWPKLLEATLSQQPPEHDAGGFDINWIRKQGTWTKNSLTRPTDILKAKTGAGRRLEFSSGLTPGGAFALTLLSFWRMPQRLGTRVEDHVSANNLR